MRAAWYDRPGPARDVLVIGELPDPEPGPGEVRVRISVSGVNPGDTKKRSDWLGFGMPFPRIVPHSDGSGVVDRVGSGVDRGLLGRRVWVHRAQSYRAFGTAAEFTVVPVAHAVELPDEVGDELGACLGIPGVTAHRAVFADGPVNGTTVLVQGILGAVGTMAAALAARSGARVIGAVRRSSDLSTVRAAGVRRHLDAVVALDDQPAEAVRELAPDGVDRVVEVAFSENVDLDAQILRTGGVLAAFGTGRPRPDLPFWPMLFGNVTVRLLGSDDFPAAAVQQAAVDLTAAAVAGDLVVPMGDPLPLERTAEAHEAVDAGSRSRVLLALG